MRPGGRDSMCIIASGWIEPRATWGEGGILNIRSVAGARSEFGRIRLTRQTEEVRMLPTARFEISVVSCQFPVLSSYTIFSVVGFSAFNRFTSGKTWRKLIVI